MQLGLVRLTVPTSGLLCESYYSLPSFVKVKQSYLLSSQFVRSSIPGNNIQPEDSTHTHACCRHAHTFAPNSGVKASRTQTNGSWMQQPTTVLLFGLIFSRASTCGKHHMKKHKVLTVNETENKGYHESWCWNMTDSQKGTARYSEGMIAAAGVKDTSSKER